MVVGVEQMRKLPLFEFGEPEGFRELGQLHLKEGHGIDETDTGRQTLELEDFISVTDLTQFETELIQRVDDGITVVPLEIMSEDGQRLFTPLTPVLQLGQKLLDARVTVPPMEDVDVGALTDQGPVSRKSRNFSGLFRVTYFSSYLQNEGVSRHETLQLFLFLLPLQHIKRPALQNKHVVVLRMAFRARKVLGTFEKRAPGG